MGPGYTWEDCLMEEIVNIEDSLYWKASCNNSSKHVPPSEVVISERYVAHMHPCQMF